MYSSSSRFVKWKSCSGQSLICTRTRTVVLQQHVRLARRRHDELLGLGQVLAHDQLEPVQTRDPVARGHLDAQRNEPMAIALDRVAVRIADVALHLHGVDRAVVSELRPPPAVVSPGRTGDCDCRPKDDRRCGRSARRRCRTRSTRSTGEPPVPPCRQTCRTPPPAAASPITASAAIRRHSRIGFDCRSFHFSPSGASRVTDNVRPCRAMA